MMVISNGGFLIKIKQQLFKQYACTYYIIKWPKYAAFHELKPFANIPLEPFLYRLPTPASTKSPTTQFTRSNIVYIH